MPLKHIHKRKKTLHPYPSKKAPYRFLDNLIYFASFAGPIMTIPQIYEIWILKNLGVSLLTWGSYLIIALIWLSYGLVHKEKPIIINNVLWIIAEIMVITGVMLSK